MALVNRLVYNVDTSTSYYFLSFVNEDRENIHQKKKRKTEYTKETKKKKESKKSCDK